mmetsp:Transcript_5876/g.13587  ORF Transcript_5876/g.13587 Transcript_5876/m.13587 type:complete len:153 (+) Transcript_5876:880-1338(+)
MLEGVDRAFVGLLLGSAKGSSTKEGFAKEGFAKGPAPRGRSPAKSPARSTKLTGGHTRAQSMSRFSAALAASTQRVTDDRHGIARNGARDGRQDGSQRGGGRGGSASRSNSRPGSRPDSRVDERAPRPPSNALSEKEKDWKFVCRNSHSLAR